MLARGKRIVEVPISYAPRSREEGKEDRSARLVHRCADVLALPQRVVLEGTKTGRHEDPI
jgi:hypothetical protein